MLTVAFGFDLFLLSQIWGLKLSPNKKTTVTQLSAQYFSMLQHWLDIRCQGLKNHKGWTELYCCLAKIVSTLANKEENLNIDYKEVLVPPSLPDLLQVCRFMFQAIINVRIGICDGQHRMGAILHALFNWEIKANYPVAEDQPPCTFEHMESTSKDPGRFAAVLADLSAEPVMVRVFVPESLAKFQEQSVAYSLAREHSQRAHKPRVLANM
jgi:hypothetical protein